MTMWLPFWRIRANPALAKMAQTASPDSTRNLPNRNLDAGDVDVAVQAVGDFGRVGAGKE